MAKSKTDPAFDNLDALTKPRDTAWSNWAKFEEVGDEVVGYIRDVFHRKAEGEFKEQRGITIEQANGELINVGIKRIPFILAKTDQLHIGDILKIVFEKELPPRQKGYKGAKQFGFYGKVMEENKDAPTVNQLENEDRKAHGDATDDEWEDPISAPKQSEDEDPI